MACATTRTSAGAWNGSSSARRTPETLSPSRYSFAASLRCMSARPRSYSYMPDSKIPLTVKRRLRGSKPAGVTLPSGVMSTTFCPTVTPSSWARAEPRMTRYLPACQVGKRTGFQARAQPDSLHLFFRQHAAHHGARDSLAIREQAARFDIGHRRLDSRHARGRGLPRTPVGDRAVEAGDGGMRGHGEHPAAKLFLETVEHRQDHDEYGDAERQAEHRHGSDEGHESAAVLRPQVANSYLPFIGPLECHGHS